MWRSKARNVAIGLGAGMAAGAAGQWHATSNDGGSQSSPLPGAREPLTTQGADRSWLEQYKIEHARATPQMPPGQPFMGGVTWGGGAAMSQVLPPPALGVAVEHLSAPSNPNAFRNRLMFGTLPVAFGAAVGGPVGAALGALGGGVLGSELESWRQSQNTPRVPPASDVPTDQAKRAEYYRSLSDSYKEADMGPQARVAAVMPPEPENVQVSRAIAEGHLGNAAPPLPALRPGSGQQDG